MKKIKSRSTLVHFAIGLYFTLSGLLGLLGYNSGSNQLLNDLNGLFGRSNNYAPLIIAICFLAAGIALIAKVLFAFKNPIVFLVILIMWCAYIIMTNFTSNFLEPGALRWLKELSLQVIILAGLWGTVLKVK